MSTPTDQSTECSQENMGDTNTKNDEAQNGQKPEDVFIGGKYKSRYAYLIEALRNVSDEAREEVSEALGDLEDENIDVAEICRETESSEER